MILWCHKEISILAKLLETPKAALWEIFSAKYVSRQAEHKGHLGEREPKLLCSWDWSHKGCGNIGLWPPHWPSIWLKMPALNRFLECVQIILCVHIWRGVFITPAKLPVTQKKWEPLVLGLGEFKNKGLVNKTKTALSCFPSLCWLSWQLCIL